MIKSHQSIREIERTAWQNLLFSQYPFLQYDFLLALETHHSVNADSGWQPCYLSYTKDNQLIGAMPLFVKYNSWGEFVFDHAIAHAYEQLGKDYYPKLVNAIPFTPATGPRILTLDNKRSDITQALLSVALKLQQDNNLSGLHTLFAQSDDYQNLQRYDALTRYDCQFHWPNHDYQQFDDFLSQLNAKKRKNIRYERRRAHNQGLNIMRLNGYSASSDDWQQFAQLYAAIYQRKHGRPAFNAAFFMDIAQKMPEQIHLACAKDGDTMIAGALMYSDENMLYGRHWGCNKSLDYLHFELCYYQGIELCIEKKLHTFEAGAQGEHKIARGFVPTRTRSLHWFTPSELTPAIEDFCRRERQGVLAYITSANEHIPYTNKMDFINDYEE